MDEKKRKMAIALRAGSTRSVQEICETLRISRATFYRYTGGATPNDALEMAYPVARSMLPWCTFSGNRL